MEFSLEDLFAEPPPKISGRPKKEEGKQGQGSYRSGLASLYSSLKRNDKDIVQEAPVAEEHVISPTKKLSKFHSQQEQRTNLDCDSGSLRDLFIEPPQKTSIKVVCPSANHNGSLDKEQNNAPLVELQKGKIGPCHDETGMQSNTEVASTTKGIAEVQIGRKVENVDELNICESELKQNDSKAKSVAPFPNIKSPSSSLSSEKRNLNSLEMNENVEEKAQRINEDKRTLEENILKKLKKTPSYHVPSLDEILGKSPMTTNIAKRSSFSLEDELKFLKKPRKETRSDLQQGKVTSDQNKNYSTDQPTIGEEFRKHFLEKKKWKDKPKVKVTEYDGCTENQFTISKQEIEGNSKNSSIMKKKAGNYLRKLHTKCRVSRKELQMLETKTVDDETDFFAEAIDRPEIAKSQQNTEITEYPYISFKKDVFAEGQVIVKSAAQRRKERKNKKRKAKKKRNRLKGVNNDANSQNSDDDDDEIILLPRKDTKPHKWPVRTKSIEQQKMQPETELGLKKEISTKDDSKRELTNESIGNQKEIVVRKRLDNASGPSLLDEIISQSATLYPGYPASSLQPSEIETQTKVDLSRFSRSAQPKTSLSGDSAGFSKLRFGENWKGTKDLNRTEMNQWWKKSSLEESKNVLNKQNIAGNIRKDDKEHLLGVDSCKQLSTTHPTLEKSAKITTEGKQQEKVISDKKMGSCLENSLIKEDNTAGDNLNDISMKEILNQELKEKSSLNIAIENARKEASKTNSTNVKEASLLSFVKDIPVDLTVTNKEEQTTSKGRSRRGGKKRKRRANKVAQGSNKGQQNKQPKLEIETKPKVKCKYFLDGKCRMGAECGFLHEGVPARRELCRYYVTDCCLAENCIFMHNEFPCKFYHAYSKCNNGNDCKYSHKELTEETRQLLDQLLARDESQKPETEKLENNQEAENETAEPATKENAEADSVSNMPKLFESLI